MKNLLFLLFLLGLGNHLNAQTEAKFVKKGIESIPLFRELLSLANNANYPSEIEKNVLWCEEAFGERGFRTQRLQTPTVPLLLAERKGRKKNAKTVLIYLQIDGQPVAPAFWNQKNPFGAELMGRDAQGKWRPISWDRINENPDPEWRIFARSASDAKGPVAAYLAALDLLAEENKRVPFHMKVIMDFEEELGSPQLPDAVVRNREALAADMLIIFDGPRHLKKPAHTDLWGSGNFYPHLNRLWTLSPATQRPLRELCAQSSRSPCPADCQYERRVRSGDHPRLLRRHCLR